MHDSEVTASANQSWKATALPRSNRREDESPIHDKQSRTSISRYGERYWAVYLNGQLLAVTVYKKGALAIQNALESPG
jgi:hypothetical protein